MGEIDEHQSSKLGKFSFLSAEIFKNIYISPRVSFWISSAALAIVLFNNHVFITSIGRREHEANLLYEQNMRESNEISKRERILRTWEVQLEQREYEIKQNIERLAKLKACR